MKAPISTFFGEANRMGEHITFTSFGESHGAAIGGVLDGIPAGMQIDMNAIDEALRRRSGKGKVGVSARARIEEDEVEWLSGIKDGMSIGTPIAFLIRNTQQRPQDYDWMKENLRPGHADYTYEHKYGCRDWRGGGRASARETAARVVAGSIARQWLQERYGIRIEAILVQVGEETDPSKFERLLLEVQAAGDSIGGIVRCCVTGVPAGIGDPIFDKLQCHLAAAMMSINGCKGFDYGSGFEGVGKRGSELYSHQPVPCPTSGGIEGGISNGLPITFRCVMKPAATLSKEYGGRHDACIAVRACEVVEAMTALVLADYLQSPDD